MDGPALHVGKLLEAERKGIESPAGQWTLTAIRRGPYANLSSRLHAVQVEWMQGFREDVRHDEVVA